MSSLRLINEQIGPWKLPVLIFSSTTWHASASVLGLIGNSITTSKIGADRTRNWKIAVAKTLFAARSAVVWPTQCRFAVTVGFSFHVPSHGNRLLNFLKPTLDALAAGLFAPNDTTLDTLARWDFDDSRFNHLLVHRLQDAPFRTNEGAALFASIQ